jgi:hypothetical protein
MVGKGTLAVVDQSLAAGGSDLRSAPAVTTIPEKGKATDYGTAGSSSAADDVVTEMMQKLNLTPQEATPFILEDEGDDDLQYPEWALVGKVLAPNTLHVNTITAVVKPAWGNPKGLIVRPMGPNMFLAEFGSEADRSRVKKGGPWCVGKHAILLKDFDP